jgi:hypothetical protein
LLLGGALGVCISAEQIKNYTVTMDDPVGITANNMPIVIRDYEHGTGEVLSLSGWIKTDQTIRRYEYTMDGGKTWKRSSVAVKSRPDTKQFNPHTYETAGYALDIDVSELPRGYYDLFVRAYTDKEDVIDVLAMIDISIGRVDKIATTYRELNLAALGAKGGGRELGFHSSGSQTTSCASCKGENVLVDGKNVGDQLGIGVFVRIGGV